MAIVDTGVGRASGRSIGDLASAFLGGSAKLLQLRAKGAPGGWLLDTASAVVALAHQWNAQVIINDRADIARLSGADGVHVGQADLDPALVRRIVGEQTMVGFSTHTREQIEVAISLLAGSASYIAVGPVFETRTKESPYEAIGVAGVRAAARAAHTAGLPLVAIGGITVETAPDVIAAGADCIAVISDLLADGNPEARVRAYIERLAV
jgi:thiamine-phosphate pyrophosphorylase